MVTRAAQKRPDDGAPAPEASLFEKDTTQVVIRCLTARAVQRVLLSLQEVDGWSAKWLNTWCATHPPLDGDKFIADLMLEAPVTLVDPYTGQSHAVSPTQIASGVLSVRQELAGHVAKGLPGAVAAGNVSVLRRHLEEHTYVSGDAGNDAARPSYRNYRRNRRAGGKAQRAAN